MKPSVSLHDLTAADLDGYSMPGKGHLHVHDDTVAIVLRDGTQLHWPSLDALDAFVDRLAQMAHEARQNATQQGVPYDPSNAAADAPSWAPISGGNISGGTDGEGTPAVAPGWPCRATSFGGYLCTLKSGHDGNHVAEGSGDDVLDVWSQMVAAS